MTTAVDTNVLTALWDTTDSLNLRAQTALNQALYAGPIVVAAPVYSELLALPQRTEVMLDRFFHSTGIAVEWNLDERIWRTAGRAFQKYAFRRRRGGTQLPRRILADFLIGAHAEVNGFTLLTLDQRLFRAAFPGLTIQAF
jgi:predicted nucleic acid-binding protein